MKPVTIEDARIVNKSFLFKQEQEIEEDEACDEFATLFNQERSPKVLITTDETPSRHIFEFIKELKEMIPNSYFYPRK
jgi:ribosome production factor 1